jgi:hypothetical protein
MARYQLKDEKEPVPAIGVAVANQGINIPEDLDLVIFNVQSFFTITVEDRTGGKWTETIQGQIEGVPYWNTSTSAVVLVNTKVDPIYLRFDGRVIARIAVTQALPFMYVPHDAGPPGQ